MIKFMKNRYIRFILVLVFLCFGEAYGQRFQISLTGWDSPLFNLTNIVQAGAKSSSIVDSSNWLNYVCKKGPNDPFYKITVHLASGTIPQGVSMFILAGYAQGDGVANAGTSTGTVQLGYTPQVILDKIGNTNTGGFKNQGHMLTMTININDFTQLQSADHNLYIVYTLTTSDYVL